MKVLVTGASGFIGRRVAAQFAAEGVELVTSSRGAPPIAGVAHHAADLLARGAVQDLIAATRPTHLVHLAWNATPGKFWGASDNLSWAAATLELARAFVEGGGRHGVFAGTCAEYDWSGPAALSEAQTLNPETFYGRIKAATGAAVLAAGEQFKVPMAWGRVFWLYGPNEPGGRLVSDVAQALAQGREADCSEGLQARDFLHVDDVACAFVAAIRTDYAGFFNIGSGEGVPVRTLVGILAESFGRPDLLRLGAKPSKPGDPPSLFADTTILTGRLGFRPTFDLRAGLEDTASWWRARPS